MSNQIPALPSASAQNIIKAYQSVDQNASNGIGANGSGAGGNSFADLLGRAVQGAVDTSKHAEAQATSAVAGHGDLTQVVTAVSRAELALQTSVAVRDRVLQAYQDIIKMPI